MNSEEHERTAAMRAELVALTREASEDVKAFIDLVVGTMDQYGITITSKAMSLAPLAQAKGDSDKEIELALDRFSRDMESNFVVLLRPKERFKVQVVSTGSLNPIAHAMPSVPVPNSLAG